MKAMANRACGGIEKLLYPLRLGNCAAILVCHNPGGSGEAWITDLPPFYDFAVRSRAVDYPHIIERRSVVIQVGGSFNGVSHGKDFIADAGFPHVTGIKRE